MAEILPINVMAEKIAKQALDEYEYKGKTIREWIDVLASAELASNLHQTSKKDATFSAERKKGEWIPCSESLPKDDGEYLVWMQWDFEEEPSYSIVNYDANAEAFGEWHEYFDQNTLGSLGSDFRSFKEVFAWMPLPEPYRGADMRGEDE